MRDDFEPKFEPGWQRAATATFNICDNRLRLTFAERLPEEQWKFMKERGGFAWWPQQKLFTAIWSPWREDLVLLMIDEIEPIMQEDDVTARVERFSDYAENATGRAEDAADSIVRAEAELEQATGRTGRIVNRIVSAKTRWAEEWSKVEYWERRASASESHAAYRESPPVIYRRIEKLESELRVAQRECSQKTTRYWRPPYENGAYVRDAAVVKASWDKWLELHTRWCAHIEMLLVYQRSLYAESGGVEADKNEPQVGGGVLWRGDWCEVVKLNKVSVSVKHQRFRSTPKVHRSEIRAVKSPAEWRAEHEPAKGDVVEHEPERLC